jgi:hypothetical protein
MNVMKVIFLPKIAPTGCILWSDNLLTAKYREVLLQKTVTAIENKTELKLNILQAVHMVFAWISLTSATMRNYFRKALFPIEENS